MAQQLSNEEILKFQKRARYVAAKRGYPELADDFAQEIFIAFARGWRSTVEQLFSSYLRGEHGDTRTQCGLERRRAKARTVSLDQPIDEEEGGTNYHDLIGDPKSHTGDIEGGSGSDGMCESFEQELYELYFVMKKNSWVIASEVGMPVWEVRDLLRPIRKERDWQRIERKFTEAKEAVRQIARMPPFEIDWIRL